MSEWLEDQLDCPVSEFIDILATGCFANASPTIGDEISGDMVSYFAELQARYGNNLASSTAFYAIGATIAGLVDVVAGSMVTDLSHIPKEQRLLLGRIVDLLHEPRGALLVCMEVARRVLMTPPDRDSDDAVATVAGAGHA